MGHWSWLTSKLKFRILHLKQHGTKEHLLTDRSGIAALFPSRDSFSLNKILFTVGCLELCINRIICVHLSATLVPSVLRDPCMVTGTAVVFPFSLLSRIPSQEQTLRFTPSQFCSLEVQDRGASLCGSWLAGGCLLVVSSHGLS